MAYLISVLFKNNKISRVFNWGVLLVIMLPSLGLSFIANLKTKPKFHYNYNFVAQKIVRDNVLKIEVPEWKDAFMFQSLLPEGYKIDYVLNPASLYFTLYNANTEEKVLVIKDNS
jgi:hypothetical protein